MLSHPGAFPGNIKSRHNMQQNTSGRECLPVRKIYSDCSRNDSGNDGEAVFFPFSLAPLIAIALV